jgi:hypothetical protein
MSLGTSWGLRCHTRLNLRGKKSSTTPHLPGGNGGTVRYSVSVMLRIGEPVNILYRLSAFVRFHG